MLISIGILAWNEESSIERTLLSLLNQSVFGRVEDYLPDARWEIIVVPNGCTDQTAAVANRVLRDRLVELACPEILWSVREISEPGKSNAWNRFVHDFSDKRADLLVFLDADIEFRETQALFRTVSTLLQSEHADAAVDLPLKDALKKHQRTLIEHISLMASNPADEIAITGQFLCARTAAMRRVWMPKGLSVEDGFLTAMVLTDCMLHPQDNRKIVRAAGASHYYETLTDLRSIFHHELRLVIGTAMNCYLLWDFLLFATDPNGPGAGALIHSQLERDPDWYAKLMANSVRNHGWWVLPKGMLFRRFGQLSRGSSGTFLTRFVTAVVGFILDLPIFLIANRKLKRHNAIGYW